MKKLKKIIFILSLIVLTGSATHASQLPNTAPAIFETYLATQQAANGNTLTLATTTLVDGSNVIGYQCLTIDQNTPSLEYECGTISGTTVSNIQRAIDFQVGTTTISGLALPHRRGADVKVTDYPILTYLLRMLNGMDTIPNVISYATTTATSSIAATNIPDAAYVLSQTGIASTSVQNTLLGGNNTWTGNNTFVPLLTLTGGFTANATSTLGNGAQISTGYDCGTGSLNTQVCAKAYIDAQVSAGAANANDTTKGIVQTATAIQAAAGTSIGSSGARLVLGSNIATSTSQVAQNSVVVTNTSGRIDPSFVTNTTYSFATTTTADIATTTLVGFPSANILDIGKNVRIFKTNGTFPIPLGISFIKATLVGGGGSGGQGGGGDAAGGGSGGYVSGIFNVTATTSLNILIGTAGSNSDGGESDLGGLASTTGGLQGNNSNNSVGGIGGSANMLSSQTGVFGFTGSQGLSSTASFTGIGANSPLGSGGKNTTSGTGGNASGYGAGGGGGTSGQSAGNGAPGIVIIEY